MAEAQMEDIAAHLEACSACLGNLPNRLPDDPLVGALRKPLAPEPCADEPECASTIDHLVAEELGTFAVQAGPETAAFPRLASDATPRVGPSTRDPAEPAFAQLPCDFGRYRILRRLGKGGMGAVYLADDTLLARQVALKVSRFRDEGPEEELRFRREARAAAALQHDGICPVFDFGVQAAVPFITMAFIEGQSLQELLKEQGKLDPPQAAELIRQAALALGEAHRRGVLHRDLKPANILLRRKSEIRNPKSDVASPAAGSDFGFRISDFSPVVVDFGLARRADDVTLTQPGATAGTPAYMSPEQIRCEPVTSATDIYSLGVILYQLLTGTVPFPGTSLTELSYQIVHTQPPPPSARCPGLDPHLDAICARAMAKVTVDRHATADDLAAELGAYLEGKRAEKWPAQLQPWRWGHAVALAACLALLASGLFFLIPLLTGRESPDGDPDLQANSGNRATGVDSRPAKQGGQENADTRKTDGNGKIGPNQHPDSPDRLEGEINVLVYENNNPARQGVGLHQKEALPLKAGDLVRVEATLNRPAYAYLVWIDSLGNAQPIYPWRPGHWEDRPAKEKRITVLRLPGEEEYWPIKETPSGMDTFLLLARETPLDANTKLATLLADLGKQPPIDPRSVVWFENFSLTQKKSGPRGALDFDNPQRIVDQVYRVHRNLEERLGKNFSYSIAASFANLGK
jgi:serine/threonine protein kinase